MKKVLHLIPNAHLDPVWFWDQRDGLNEELKTCRTMVKLMKQYPELTFIQGEAAIYSHIEQFAPELFEEIRELVRAGRWDIVGGNWIQPDQNMPDTAAFLKQFSIGKAYFQEKFGVDVKTAWSADSFGHSAGIPEILAGAGFRHFAFTRPGLQQFHPKDNLFFWEGPGKSHILCLRMHASYSSMRNHLPRLENAVESLAKDFPNRRNYALAVGLGDHGGGTSVRQVEDALSFIRNTTEMEVRFSTFLNYFAAAEAEIADGFSPETIRTELNGCLRGCYASLPSFKSHYRNAENKLREAANVSAVLESAAPDFSSEWKSLLFNQFHDILPGTMIERAAEEQHDELGLVLHSARVKEFAALNRLTKKINVTVPEVPYDHPEAVPFLVFNPLPHPFQGMVELESCMDFRPLKVENPMADVVEVRDGGGQLLPYQYIRTEHSSLLEYLWRKRVLVPLRIPAFGWQIVTVGYQEVPQKAVAPASAVKGNGFSIENGLLRLAARIGGEALELQFADGRNVPLSFARYADEFGSWGGMSDEEESIRLQALQEVWKIRDVKLLESGPERARLWVKLSGENSRLALTASLERNAPSIRFEARISRNDRASRLKLRLPRAARAVYEIPGGEIERGEHVQLPGGKYAKLYSPEFADLAFASIGGYGFDNQCGFFTWTLDRSCRYASDTIAGEIEYREEAVEDGELKLRFAIGDAAEEAHSAAAALAFPPYVLMCEPHEGELPVCGSLLEINSPDVELLHVERTSESVPVLTLRNVSAQTEVGSIRWKSREYPFELAPWKITKMKLS